MPKRLAICNQGMRMTEKVGNSAWENTASMMAPTLTICIMTNKIMHYTQRWKGSIWHSKERLERLAEIDKNWKSYTCFSADYLNTVRHTKKKCSICFRVASPVLHSSVSTTTSRWHLRSPAHCHHPTSYLLTTSSLCIFSLAVWTVWKDTYATYPTVPPPSISLSQH